MNAALAPPYRGAVWLGQRSYGLYLWHFPIILSVYGRTADFLPPETSYIGARIALILVCALGFAWTSWSLLERPAQDVGRRFSRRRRPAISVPSTVHEAPRLATPEPATALSAD